jgi:hypothetical protein
MGGLSNVSLTANQRQEIERGQAAVNRRRAEFAYMANGSRKKPHKPQPPRIKQPAPAKVETIPSQYPESVAFYSYMGIDAARRLSGVGGAWRLYILAKELDRKGLGKIPRADLRAFALHLGLNPRTYQRWIIQAERRGVLSYFQKESGEWWVNLQSPAKLCHAMGWNAIGKKMQIDPALLIGPGWKANIWASASAGLDGRQISRERLQKVYNVPARTQTYRDNQADVNRQSNYADTGIIASAGDLPAWQQNNSQWKGLFRASNGHLYRRLPDTRATNKVILIGTGRGKKALSELRHLQDITACYKRDQALANGIEDSEYIRLFNRNPKQLKTSKRKLERQEKPRVVDVFQHIYDNKDSGAGIWDTINL